MKYSSVFLYLRGKEKKIINTVINYSLSYEERTKGNWLYTVLAGQRPQVRGRRTVNQRRGGKARERWHEQGGTWGLVAGLYWCVGLLLPTSYL